MVALWDAVQANDMSRAAALQRAVIELHGSIGPLGIPGIKALLEYRGFRAGQPRSPLAPLDQTTTERAIAAWKQAMGMCEWWE